MNFLNNIFRANYLIGAIYKSKEIKEVYAMPDHAGYVLLFTDGTSDEVSVQLVKEILEGKHTKSNSDLVKDKLGIN